MLYRDHGKSPAAIHVIQHMRAAKERVSFSFLVSRADYATSNYSFSRKTGGENRSSSPQNIFSRKPGVIAVLRTSLSAHGSPPGISRGPGAP